MMFHNSMITSIYIFIVMSCLSKMINEETPRIVSRSWSGNRKCRIVHGLIVGVATLARWRVYCTVVTSDSVVVSRCPTLSTVRCMLWLMTSLYCKDCSTSEHTNGTVSAEHAISGNISESFFSSLRIQCTSGLVRCVEAPRWTGLVMR